MEEDLPASSASDVLTGLIKPQAIAEELAEGDTPHRTVESSAAREEQIQKAISFLTHPKVKGSSKEAQILFLERKGLSQAEIDEAYKRVADDNSAKTISAPTTVLASTPPPRKPFASGHAVSALQPVVYNQQPQPQGLQWTQIILGVSVIATGAYAIKQLVGPYAIRWYRRLYGIQQPPEVENRDAEEKRSADIVATALQSQTAELRSTVESLKEAVRHLQKGKSPASGSGLSVSDLRAELHAFAATLSVEPNKSGEAEKDVREELQELKALLTEKFDDIGSSRPSSARLYTSGQSGTVPNGTHNVAPPASRVAYKAPQSSSPAPSGGQPAHPQSYMDVLEMLEKGQTPPGIRSDINDKPPNPLQQPPSTRQQPRTKPWERQLEQISGGADTKQAEPTHGVTITELDSSPSTRPSTADEWTPPPMPAPSLPAKIDNDCA